VTLVWTWQQTVPTGYVVYLMLIDGDVKKGGIAKDTATSTFKKRMQSEFASVRQVIVGPIPGKPLPGERFLVHAKAISRGGFAGLQVGARIAFAALVESERGPRAAGVVLPD
jgi:hypothetical protein